MGRITELPPPPPGENWSSLPYHCINLLICYQWWYIFLRFVFFLSIKRLPDSPQSFFGRVERTALCRWSGEQSSSGTWRRKWQSFAWSKRLRRASFRSALSRQTWYVRIISECRYLERAASLLCLCVGFSRFILRHVFWMTACQSVLLDCLICG